MGVNIQTTAPNRYEPTASPPKGANKFTRVFRASIHPAFSARYLVLVLSRPILSCPLQCTSSVQLRTCFHPLPSTTSSSSFFSSPPTSMCSFACETSPRFALVAPSHLFLLFSVGPTVSLLQTSSSFHYSSISPRTLFLILLTLREDAR